MLCTEVNFLREDTIVSGFPKAKIGTLIFFAKEKLTFIYYGDGEWRSVMNHDYYEYYETEEKEKEKEISW